MKPITHLLSAAPANRASSCSVILPFNQSLVFGSGKQLAVWLCTHQHARYPPCSLFKAHPAEITVIKNLHSNSSAVISGDSIGNVIISIPIPEKWKILTRLTGHKRSISCLSSIKLPYKNNEKEEYLILAGASDGSLISWKVEINSSSDLMEYTNNTLQTIQIDNQIALDTALAFLPNQSNHLVLALAGTDGKIAIYSFDFSSLLFSICFRLPGHTDWVRCLDFILDPKQSQNLLLVSGSQDNFIRIWRCEKEIEENSFNKSTSNLTIDDPFQTLDELTQSLKEQGQLTNTQNILPIDKNRQSVEMKKYSIKNTCWSFVSDALLYGHEGWITNVHWCINPTGTLQLLSTSSDRSMIMWRASEEFDNVWLNVERFGELATSTNLGFFGAHYFINPQDNSETVLASGWTRAWHRWSKVNNKLVWDPQIAPTAHYGPVTGLDWEKEGDYLITCSTDQTTRIWGSWNKSSCEIETNKKLSWHEICRPQVHGHDLFGVSFIDDGRSKFVSISEEKVIRAFEMTQDFIKIIKELNIIQSSFFDNLNNSQKIPERAIVPALGLSNRVEDLNESNQVVKNLSQVTLQSCPPFEDQLLSKTLWPEIDKIYGHPSELSAIATSNDGKLIASACHGNSIQTASIRIHKTNENFNLIKNGILQVHSLTVTKLIFNQDNSKLLSVSRDRSWSVWKKIKNNQFQLDQVFEKSHNRVIWDAAWSPSFLNPSFFVTGSRDKFIKTWVQSDLSSSVQSNEIISQKENKDKKNWNLSGLIKFDQPVKSCDISSILFNHNQILLAVGLEDGSLFLYSTLDSFTWTPITNINLSSVYHDGAINRISFYPKKLNFIADVDDHNLDHKNNENDNYNNENKNLFRLATAGDDSVVKIFDLIL